MVIADWFCLPYGIGYYGCRVYSVDSWGEYWYSPRNDTGFTRYWQ